AALVGIKVGLSETNLCVLKIVDNVSAAEEGVAEEDGVAACGFNGECAGWIAIVEGGLRAVCREQRGDKLREGNIYDRSTLTTECEGESEVVVGEGAANYVAKLRVAASSLASKACIKALKGLKLTYEI